LFGFRYQLILAWLWLEEFSFFPFVFSVLKELFLEVGYSFWLAEEREQFGLELLCLIQVAIRHPDKPFLSIFSFKQLQLNNFVLDLSYLKLQII